MKATVKFELFGNPHSQETRDFEDKQAGMDMIRNGVLLAVVSTINDLTYLARTVPSRWIDMLHQACDGTSMPYTVNFDNGEVESDIIDVTKEALARFALEHTDDETKERITDHVRNCTNDECPVNDFFEDVLSA